MPLYIKSCIDAHSNIYNIIDTYKSASTSFLLIFPTYFILDLIVEYKSAFFISIPAELYKIVSSSNVLKYIFSFKTARLLHCYNPLIYFLTI